MMIPCSYCQTKEAKRLCGACEFVPYCSEECSSLDWPAHFIEAHPFDSHKTGLKEEVATEILPGLWVGGIKALKHLDTLGIGAVVTAIQHDKPGVEKMLTRTVGERPSLRLKWYDSPDQELTLGEMCRAAGFIEQYLSGGGGGGVLVHCWAGHSRSVSIVLFYLMKKTKRFKTLGEALVFIQSKRPYAGPNPGFISQLEKLIRQPGC